MRCLGDICKWEFNVDQVIYVCKHGMKLKIKKAIEATQSQDFAWIKRMHDLTISC